MRLYERIDEMQREARTLIRAGNAIGFVPTMGALHEGHLSLIRRAADENDVVVVSIFVNPIQFNDEDDFQNYPRELEMDLHLAAEAGATIAFVPDAESMYPPNRDTFVQVQRLANHLCGITRGRGHFIGVCTVVCKLFHIVQPDRAYFGQKDAQQALIIQRMVLDLNLPVEVVVCPIVREADGLAMSSRNERLTETARDSALCLHRALRAGRDLIRDGERKAVLVMSRMAEEVVCDPAVQLEYLDIVSPETLEDVEEIDDLVLIAGAIHVGGVRLIDNLLVGPDGPFED